MNTPLIGEPHIVVVSRRPGMIRGGVGHPAVAVHAIDRFTPVQLADIVGEPEMTVVFGQLLTPAMLTDLFPPPVDPPQVQHLAKLTPGHVAQVELDPTMTAIEGAAVVVDATVERTAEMAPGEIGQVATAATGQAGHNKVAIVGKKGGKTV